MQKGAHKRCCSKSVSTRPSKNHTDGAECLTEAKSFVRSGFKLTKFGRSARGVLFTECGINVEGENLQVMRETMKGRTKYLKRTVAALVVAAHVTLLGVVVVVASHREVLGRAGSADTWR